MPFSILMRSNYLSRLPPLPLQPSLGYFFSHVNMEWKRGYEGHINHAGHLVSAPKLSHVVIVSISGGIFDYQVPCENSMGGFHKNITIALLFYIIPIIQ